MGICQNRGPRCRWVFGKISCRNSGRWFLQSTSSSLHQRRIMDRIRKEPNLSDSTYRVTQHGGGSLKRRVNKNHSPNKNRRWGGFVGLSWQGSCSKTISRLEAQVWSSREQRPEIHPEGLYPDGWLPLFLLYTYIRTYMQNFIHASMYI